jgi:hypothetical protein
MKALSYCKPRGKKKYPGAKYIGEKISCAALLQEKNICLIPLGRKKNLAD